MCDTTKYEIASCAPNFVPATTQSTFGRHSIGCNGIDYLLNRPGYTCSMYRIKCAQFQIPYYLDEDNKWGLSIDELQRSVEAAKAHCLPRILVVINPGNPTGENSLTIVELEKYNN